MKKNRSDIEIINFLNSNKKFRHGVRVTHFDLSVELNTDYCIDKKLIEEIESITDGDYYFYDNNRKLIIPRVTPCDSK